jgi:hypothetical protein
VFVGGVVESITNAGHIEATLAGRGGIVGVQFQAPTQASSALLTNAASGSITGATGVVFGSRYFPQSGFGTVLNDGAITGTSGVAVSFLDGGLVTNGVAGEITGGIAIAGFSTAGTVTNYGSIAGAGVGVSFASPA